MSHDVGHGGGHDVGHDVLYCVVYSVCHGGFFDGVNGVAPFECVYVGRHILRLDDVHDVVVHGV